MSILTTRKNQKNHYKSYSPKKIMISVGLDNKEHIYCEILPRNQMINVDVQIQQLVKLNNSIKENRSE